MLVIQGNAHLTQLCTLVLLLLLQHVCIRQDVVHTGCGVYKRPLSSQGRAHGCLIEVGVGGGFLEHGQQQAVHLQVFKRGVGMSCVDEQTF